MSGKSAKRLRREEQALQERSLEAPRPADTLLKRMVRKHVLSYVLAAGLAIGGIEIAREQLPFVMGKKPEYSLKLVFLDHDNRSDALRLLGEMDAAEKAGKPFKVLFAENGDLNSTDYDGTVTRMDAVLSVVKSNYLAMVTRGFSPQEAEAEVSSLLHVKTTGSDAGFINTVFAGAAIRGIKLLPLEAYSAEQCQEYDGYHQQDMQARERWDELTASNAPLGELMRCQMELQEIGAKLVTERNKQIEAKLEGRFDHAKELFPMLRLERIKGSELRAIGWIGLQHLAIARDFVSPRNKLLVTGETYGHELHPVVEEILTGMDKPRPFTKREAYIAAIEGRWTGSVVSQLSERYPEIVGRLMENLEGMSEADLERIDLDSSKISNRDERGRFVLNTIIGYEYFMAGKLHVK